MTRPPCAVCGAPLSPAIDKKYTGRDPECGGMVPGLHVGLTRNGITCRADDPNDKGRRSTWREIRDQIKERSRRR